MWWRGWWASAEYLGDVVDGLYVSYLGRHADTQGLSFWVNSLQGGATVENVRSAILGSDEFLALSGGTTQGFITRVYDLVLGRSGFGRTGGMVAGDYAGGDHA